MSLNDPDSHYTDPDSPVKPMYTQDENTPKVTVNMPADGSLPKEPTDADIELLTQAQVKLNFVEDKHTAIVDMADVEQSIAQESAISQAHYHTVVATFGKDIFNTLKPEHFTFVPTKTNLAYSQLRMRAKIASESAVVNATLTEVFSDLKMDVAGALNRCKEHYIPACLKIVQQFMTEYPNMGDYIRSGCYVAQPTGVVNLHQSSINPEAADSNATGLVADMQQVVDLTSWPHVLLLAYCMGNNTEFAAVVGDVEAAVKAKSYAATVVDLVDMCATEKGANFFAGLSSFVDELNTSLIDLPAVTPALAGDPVLKELDTKLHIAKEAIVACYYFCIVAQRLSAVAPALYKNCQ